MGLKSGITFFIFNNTKLIKIWDVDVYRIVVSKLIKTKNNSKHLI